MNDTQPDISIIIPAYNEAESIKALHGEIIHVCESAAIKYEVVLVDDGSTDKTGDTVAELESLTYIRLRRNFGQTAAIDCGIKHSRGKILVLMDGDGQNDPRDIPKLLQHLEEHNLDVVSGWRKQRKDPTLKRWSSRCASLARNFIVGDNLHDSGCSLKAYRAECFHGITLYGEMHRFIPAILKIKGFKIGEIEVHHRRREKGITKYGWKRGIKGLIDMVSVWFWHRYAVRPLHLLGGIGALAFSIGCMVAAVGVLFYLYEIRLFRHFLPLLSVFLLLSGIQLFIFGLIADMLSKNYFETTKDTPYSIEKIKHPQPPASPHDEKS